jgi:Glycosyl Hydrolase Family 88
MCMAPPFLAYYAAATQNASLLQVAVSQAGLYRQILQSNTTKGLWEHIIGPQSYDGGLWSTGNAWAAAGMTRVLATVLKSGLLSGVHRRGGQEAATQLGGYIKEILDGAIASPVDPENGLLRNYLNDTSTDGHGFGEISGTTLLASVAYRVAILQPQTFTAEYITWADSVRKTIGNGQHVSTNGTVYPAVNPLGWTDTVPYTAGSPEGNNFVVLMYAAWRDCVLLGICKK